MDLAEFRLILRLVIVLILLVALGGKILLAEFPELCGVEQELIDRSVNEANRTKNSSI